MFDDNSGNGKGSASEETSVEESVEEEKKDDKHDLFSSLPEPVISTNALTVLRRRYLKKDNEGEVVESPKMMFWRVAKAIAAGEKSFNGEFDDAEMAVKFYEMMSSLDFVPNSPTLMNAGRQLGQLAACFVLPVEDTMEAIFEAVKNAALVHKSGGGTGFSFSRLRARGSMVQSTAGTASGPVSFMTVFNAATETIKQGGTRRGANMGILRVDHPDIRDFINCKKDMVSITNFNISVAITDDFMEALQNGEKYNIFDPGTGNVTRQENAADIFDLITENTWLNGDPGIVFIDEINRHNNTPNVGQMEATNPCGEQPLLPYESCNLGSINLNNMVSGGKIDWDRLRRTVRLSTRFLDNVIEINKYPIEKIRTRTQENRKIGLGVMGFADMLYAQGIPYNSTKAISIARKVMKFINDESRQMSDELAEERGAFPNCEGSVFDHPTRNATVTTIAPTGTISMIADTSGGVEPGFALVFVKRVMDDDRLLYINRHFEEAARSGGFYSRELMEKIAEGKHLAELDEVPDEIKQIFVTAHDIAPEWHIRMQAAFQEHTDNAVSKTINLSHNATIEDVKKSYMTAWRLKCKGITIYRDGSRTAQVLNVGNGEAEKITAEAQSKSPEQPVDKPDNPPSEEAAVQTKPSSSAAETGRDVERRSVDRRRSKTPFLKPRYRPLVTYGCTEQVKTGEGTLYVTINEDDDGLSEVFASLGKAGGNAAAQSEAIGRLISLAIRSGVDPRHIVKQLKGISGLNPIWHDGVLIRSTPDAIGYSLERYLDRKYKRQTELALEGFEKGDSVDGILMDQPDKPNIEYAYGIKVKELCPDCESDELYFEEGCVLCRVCGYSKCG
ncbi:vitamin B12-dependent ribonucleotide reductase [bacterium]|nr:vitamin B12-dependent ribonucleotide reductase [bacterium]